MLEFLSVSFFNSKRMSLLKRKFKYSWLLAPGLSQINHRAPRQEIINHIFCQREKRPLKNPRSHNALILAQINLKEKLRPIWGNFRTCYVPERLFHFIANRNQSSAVVLVLSLKTSKNLSLCASTWLHHEIITCWIKYINNRQLSRQITSQCLYDTIPHRNFLISRVHLRLCTCLLFSKTSYI